MPLLGNCAALACASLIFAARQQGLINPRLYHACCMPPANDGQGRRQIEIVLSAGPPSPRKRLCVCDCKPRS
jgi:hypothetical protein